jgi:hypothetical protein
MWTGLAVYCPYGTKTLNTCTPVGGRSPIEDDEEALRTSFSTLLVTVGEAVGGSGFADGIGLL